MKKRFISLFLVLCMVLTLLPVPAFAEEPEVPKKILHEYVNDSKYYPRIRIEEVTENQEEMLWDYYSNIPDDEPIDDNDDLSDLMDFLSFMGDDNNE